ncbi:TspO protein [Candidatus Gottesmanbacteria bacterium RIFCSPHIGHO2_12_FULL_40_13]|nr:MAG: TspO protein [Candidatus Gottesmanbacteria bacterium RIFCSPHIGHO2_12_FULL_40_13]
MPNIKNWLLFIFAIFLSEGVGILGSLFTVSSIPTWYANLTKPPFSPPNYVFGPVWTTLYALMGISLYLVWISRIKSKQYAVKLFFVQLALNAVWSIIFFGLKRPGLAFIEIIALWVAIILTIKAFQKISKTASYLLYPYLAWVSFASILNFAIWILNR